MDRVKRISVGKNDEAAAIAEKIIDADADEIFVSVPKFSRIAESVSNFHLLKREADALERKLTIESVDDKVIELCRKSDLPSINPFFNREPRQFSDIVTRRGKGKGRGHSESPAAPEREAPRTEETKEKQHSRLRMPHPLRLGGMGRIRSFLAARGPRRVFIVAVVLLAGFVILALFGLPRADIVLVPVTVTWEYKGAVTADTGLNAVDLPSFKIPAQLFSERKNVQLSFPATGKRNVEKRATGKLTIYNAYSATPQPLVGNTRFETLDGKIFRLTRSVIIPGATVVNGNIQPASIEVAVAADAPGPALNIAPTDRFTIPGFRGSPKFAGFYGRSTAPMTGGALGEVLLPTEEDIRKAKEEVRKTLEETAKAFLLTKAPKMLKVLDGASQFRVQNETVSSDVDDKGAFSVFAEGEFTVIAFREEDLTALLLEKARTDQGKRVVVRSETVEYTTTTPNFADGFLTFGIEYKGVVARDIRIEEVRARILGLSEKELRAYLAGLSGLERAQVSLWPFWVRRVPTKENRVVVLIR